MANIENTYWFRKAKELEAEGKTEEARRYKIRRPLSAGDSKYGKFLPLNKSLAGTLDEAGGKELSTTPEPAKTLKGGGIDGLASLKSVMGRLTDNYKRKQVAKGFGSVEEKLIDMGFSPEKMSGGLTAGILQMMQDRVATPIESIYNTMVTHIDETRKNSLTGLETLINEGAMGNLKTEDLKKLSVSTGVPLEQLEALKMTQEGSDVIRDSYIKGVESGNISMSGVPAEYKDDVISNIDWTKVPQKADALTLNQRANLETQLGNNFERYVKDARKAVMNAGNVNIAMTAIQNDLDSGGSLNAPSQVIINSFNKIMDASSVVRESEYARTGTGLSLVGQIEGLFTKLVAGGAGVSVKDLQDFVDLSNQLVEGYKQQQLNFAQRVKSQSDTYGLKIENIVTPDVLEMLNDPSLIVTGGGSGGTQSDEDAYQQYLEKTNE